VNENTADKLLALNRQFYQTFAHQFSQTRQRLQPGVKQILETIPRNKTILDLGCGNGELAHELAQRGHQGIYVGLDSSRDLLTRAREKLDSLNRMEAGDKATPEEPTPGGFQAIFIQRDLAAPDWDASIPHSPFEVVLAFAVLHHLPSHSLRRQILLKSRSLLEPAGVFIHSEWQFLNSPRLKARIQPWESIQVKPQDVDPNDYLLDWRRGGYGFRYVHHFNQKELDELAQGTGFTIRHTFHSDGKGGNLGLYQIWEAV